MEEESEDRLCRSIMICRRRNKKVDAKNRKSKKYIVKLNKLKHIWIPKYLKMFNFLDAERKVNNY